jgi:hypothetical protein
MLDLGSGLKTATCQLHLHLQEKKKLAGAKSGK